MVMASISSLSSGVFNHTTYYDTLGICPSATEQEIKDAYRRLAILKHPDKNLADPAGACAAFQQLQTAYDTLSDSTLRAKYTPASFAAPTNQRHHAIDAHHHEHQGGGQQHHHCNRHPQHGPRHRNPASRALHLVHAIPTDRRGSG